MCPSLQILSMKSKLIPKIKCTIKYFTLILPCLLRVDFVMLTMLVDFTKKIET